VTLVSADLSASYAVRGHNPVHHAIRHCVYGKRPFVYLLVIDDCCRPRGEQAVFEQLFHTPPISDARPVGSGIELLIEFGGPQCLMSIEPLDEGAELEEASFKQHDVRLFAEHPVWHVRRAGRHLVMPTLLLVHAPGSSAEISGSFDAGQGAVTLTWSIDGLAGVDMLRFDAGTATGAVFTRELAPPAA
jgi:hypothetical protein